MKWTLFYDIIHEILSLFNHVAAKHSRFKREIVSFALLPRNDIPDRFMQRTGFDPRDAVSRAADGNAASLPDHYLVPAFGDSHTSGFFHAISHAGDETRPRRCFPYRYDLRTFVMDDCHVKPGKRGYYGESSQSRGAKRCVHDQHTA